MAFILFDVDNGLSSIGGQAGAAQIAGIPPITIPNITTQTLCDVMTVGRKRKDGSMTKPLFVPTTIFENHPVMDIEYTVWGLSPAATEAKISGVVIDTFSFVHRNDKASFRQAIDKDGKVIQKDMEQKDWGRLEAGGEKLFGILNGVKTVWKVVNIHQDLQKKTDDPRTPDLQGGFKASVFQYADVVVYTKVSKEKRKFFWQTFDDGTCMNAKSRVTLPEVIDQDFRIIFDAYKKAGEHPPFILVVGASGTGKTTALKTLAGL